MTSAAVEPGATFGRCSVQASDHSSRRASAQCKCGTSAKSPSTACLPANLDRASAARAYPGRTLSACGTIGRASCPWTGDPRAN
jgi:hypothetical protein